MYLSGFDCYLSLVSRKTHIVPTVEDYTHLRKVLQIIKFKGYSKVKFFKFKIYG